MANIMLHFGEKGGSSKASALTDGSGHFKVMHSSGKAGIEMGSYHVWVSMPNYANDPNKPRKDPNLAMILYKFGVSEKSTKTVEITGPQEIRLDF